MDPARERDRVRAATTKTKTTRTRTTEQQEQLSEPVMGLDNAREGEGTKSEREGSRGHKAEREGGKRTPRPRG